MKRLLCPLLVLATTTLAAAPAAASTATRDEAVAMVKKGVAAVTAMGPEKAYAEFSTPAGKWVDRDLYLVVFRLDGTSLAHGANPKQVGVNLMDRKDIDGKEFIRERMELAKAKPSFWQDYKFLNPVSKKIEPKTMYCERQSDTVVCAGVYK
ncbi:cache domain-containing protein [Piscinibacter sakaiensis]|uniref:Methyl-accepting chemotaxis protein I n=1 Tax=Piscinibacter sakaiensis TaxID=1547922 RepID=A0A0K8P2P3_PISS1|nr:cache domain-containing protein [Piscinibacter sakaiensis]GAP36942.1 methyl-accepting chemotaxis protein I [Piscinibacter sakaiensis]